jgi:UDP-2-acetamido-3-amino-2,3-dideoxy-glucuronate N-acetyltransferase
METQLNNKIAVVGVGAWGRNHVRVLQELGSLGAVCDLNIESVPLPLPSGVDRTADLTDILGDGAISAIVVSTPAETHHEIAKTCLEAGKDVLVEKPLALKTKHAEELISIAERNKRILMVGHVLLYHPTVLKLRELIRSGDLGKINYIYSNRLNFGKIRTEENILWSFAPHDISSIVFLLGETPEEVTAHGASYLHKSIADVTLTNLRFRSGVHGHIFVSWLHPFKEQKLIVVGDKKMAVFNDAVADRQLLLYPHKINWINRIPRALKAEEEVIPVEAKEPLKEEHLHFLECIRTRRKPRSDGSEGLRVLEILSACQQSLEGSGRSVQLPIESTGETKKYFVHPTSTVDIPCDIGEGTKIWHYSHIMQHSKIGSRCNIGQNVVIAPNVTLGDNVKVQNNVSVYTGVICKDDVFLGPSMVFTNVTNPRSHVNRRDEFRQTLVKKGATIGANATIICGHTLGEYAFIGAGAVVTKDVGDYALVVGNPARQVGWMCKCGERLPQIDAGVLQCGKCKKMYLLRHHTLQPQGE